MRKATAASTLSGQFSIQKNESQFLIGQRQCVGDLEAKELAGGEVFYVW